MKRLCWIVLVMAGGLWAAPWLRAQAPASRAGKPSDAEASQKAPVPASGANPFPEDTSNVPVMPSKDTPEKPVIAHDGAASAPLPLPGDELDPVPSPDDAPPEAASVPDVDSDSGSSAGFSSSQSGLESLLPPPGEDQPNKRKKQAKPETQKEEASKDIEVGSYYMDQKDWKGALSRFESAMVLDPDNPEIYWGLALANRHLGNLAEARANYEKVALYDPDSRHGKEAIKALKEPEIANGKNAATSHTAEDAAK